MARKYGKDRYNGIGGFWLWRADVLKAQDEAAAALAVTLAGKVAVEDVVAADTGEVVARKGQTLDAETAFRVACLMPSQPVKLAAAGTVVDVAPEVGPLVEGPGDWLPVDANTPPCPETGCHGCVYGDAAADTEGAGSDACQWTPECGR